MSKSNRRPAKAGKRPAKSRFERPRINRRIVAARILMASLPWAGPVNAPRYTGGGVAGDWVAVGNDLRAALQQFDASKQG